VLDCQILVVSSEMGDKFLYKGHEGLNKKRLFVYLVQGENELAHYHSIVKISGFFTQSYWCEHCLTPFNNNHKHQCDVYCRVCKRDDCLVQDDQVSCKEYHMTCMFSRPPQNQDGSQRESDTISVHEMAQV
jgi:hypothetical protein